MGKLVKLNYEFTIPLLSQSQFLKAELFYKKYHDLDQ